MQTFLAATLVCLILTQLCATPTDAWGFVAHKTVAGLAQRFLSDESWAWVRHIEGYKEADLVDICVQADEYGYSQYGGWSLPLHYVNSPFSATQFDMARDCGESVGHQCIVNAIFNYTYILQKAVSSQQPVPTRAQRQRLPDVEWVWHSAFAWEGPEPSPLAFLVHFTSDLGQPLHAGFACDKGGNSVITSNNWGSGGSIQLHNLHKVWYVLTSQSLTLVFASFSKSH